MLNAVVGLVVLLASVVIHENAHGWVALSLGDGTARDAQRLTLNPVRHLDIVGSIILPAVLWFSAGTMFGYAKPVPVNPANLRGKDRWGFAAVALAGPVSNMVLAFIAALALRRLTVVSPSGLGDPIAALGIGGAIALFTFQWNLVLAAFNLLPIPPLDGSRLIRPVLSANGRRILDRIEPYGFLILLGLILWLQQPLFRIVGLIQSGLVRLLPL